MKIQHGDVILVKIDVISKGSKKLKIEDGYILERGEGVHTHVLKTVEGVDIFETTKKEIEMIVTKPTILDHEEHGVKIIQPGIYRKVIENEYDAEKDEAYKTRD